MKKNKKKFKSKKPIIVINIRWILTTIAIAFWTMFCIMVSLKKFVGISDNEIQDFNTTKWVFIGMAITCVVGAFITFFICKDQYNDQKILECYCTTEEMDEDEITI